MTRKPGEKGTKQLVKIYGDQLVRVRYRYDPEKKRRYKTVELIVDICEWIPPTERVLVRVEWGEKELAYRVKRAGGTWNKEKKAWELAYQQVVQLGLEHRLLREWETGI